MRNFTPYGSLLRSFLLLIACVSFSLTLPANSLEEVCDGGITKISICDASTGQPVIDITNGMTITQAMLDAALSGSDYFIDIIPWGNIVSVSFDLNGDVICEETAPFTYPQGGAVWNGTGNFNLTVKAYHIAGCNTDICEQQSREFIIEPITGYDCFAVSDGNDNLYEWNSTDATNNIIGSTGVANIETIELNDDASILWGINAGTFGTINQTTGTFSSMGAIGSGSGALGTITFSDVDGLSLDYYTGDLWASHRRGGAYDLLLKIDPVTGDVIQDAFGANEYVVIDGSGIGFDIDDLAMDPTTGILYASNNNSGSQLVTINTATGDATIVGNFGVGDIEGLSFTDDGTLWATTGAGGVPNSLYTINISTGHATFVSEWSSGSDFESLACFQSASIITCSGNIDNIILTNSAGSSVTLTDGATYDFGTLPTGNFLEAIVSGTHESFKWIVDGTVYNENSLPYNYPSTSNGQTWNVGCGTHTIIGELWSLDGQTGALCDEISITFTVNCPPPSPCDAVNDTFTECGTFDGDVSLNDDCLDGDYSLVSGPTCGNLTFNNDGTFTFSSTTEGTCTFTYEACNMGTIPGEEVCQGGTLYIEVEYLGPNADLIEFTNNDGSITFASFSNVSTGDILTITNTTGTYNGQNNNWDAYVDGAFNTQLHVSCSVDLLGVTFGDFTILSYGDASGNVNTLLSCSTATVTIEILNPVFADAGADESICAGELVTLGGSPTASGNSSPYTYAWSSGQTTANPNVQVTSTTTYTVTVTGANGCTATDQVTYTVLPAPFATASSTNADCGIANGTASAGQFGGTAPYTYEWNDGQTTQTATGLTPGSYTVTVTDANGCTGVAQIGVGEDNDLIASVSASPTTVCEGSTTTITATVDFGGTAPFTYSWSDGSSGSVITPTVNSTTNYIVTVTDVNGCLAIDNVQISTYAQPSVSTSSTQADCGVANGTATASGSGGTPGYTYSWSNGGSGTTITNLTPGNYTVTITDANGCQETSTVTVGETNSINAIASVNPGTICEGESATVSASVTGGVSPYSYSWSSGQSSSSFTASPTSSTTYTVTITDTNGCVGIDNVTLNVTPLPNVDAGPDVLICGSETVTIGGNPIADNNSSYTWSSGQTGTTSGNNNGQITVSPSVTTTYCVTVTKDGCSESDCTTVTVNDPQVNAGADDAICSGESTTLNASATGGAGGYSYSWSNGSGSASQTVSPTATTTYTVTVTDADGCSTTDAVTVTVNPNPVASMSSTEADCGISNGTATVSVSSGTAGFTYSWSNGGSSSTITNLSPGTYNVTVTDANGCTDTGSVLVGENNNIVATATASPGTICFGESSTVSSSVAGGNAPYAYSWSTGQSSSSFTVSPNSTTTYTVTITDANGCQGVDNVTVNVTPLPSVDAGADVIICGSETVTIGGNPVGINNATYAWSTGQTGTIKLNGANLDLGQISVSPTVTTTYCVTVTDNGCSETDCVTVTVNDPQVNAGADQEICSGESVTLTANATGGAGGYSYSWSNGFNGPSQSITPSATTTYTVTVTDADGCSTTDAVTVTVYPNPILSTSSTEADCGIANGTATVSVSSGTANFTYSWSNGGSSSTITGLVPGSYGVTVVDANGCTANSTVIVGENNNIVATASASPTTICEGESSNISSTISGGNAPYSYSWSSGQSTSSFTASPTTTTTYTVTITDTNGCQGIDAVTLNVTPLPTVDAGADQTIICGDPILIGGNPIGDNGATYVWSTGATGTITGANTGQITVSPLETTTYTVEVTQNGCSDIDEVLVTVLCEGEVCGHLYLDTDGDGMQDAGEPNLAGVDVIITDSEGTVYTVTSDGNGDYCQIVASGDVTVDVDETDPDYPAGYVQTEGNDPTTVNVPPAGNADAGNDGYYLAAEVCGHLYLDTNGNGVQDVGEPNLANVDVVITASDGSVQTVTTDAFGDYCAAVPPGETTADVDESDPDYPAGAEQTEGNDPTTVTAGAGTTTDIGTDGYYTPGEVCGHLYIDTNGNGMQDAGEPNLANVDVIITDSNGAMYTVSTDANGDYCQEVPPGSTTIDVDENDPDYPTGYDQTEGNDPTVVDVDPGTSTDGGNDGYYLPAEVCGHLYLDTNGNGTQDVGEPDLANVDVLITDSNGTSYTVTSDSNGDYCQEVPPGFTLVNVDESDPDYPAGAEQTEGEDPTAVDAVAGETTDAGIDGYYTPGELCGHLYIDANGNGNQDPGEVDLANVDVIITDSNGDMYTVTTNATGDYCQVVPPGVATVDVDETDPDYPAGAEQTEGDDPTTVTVGAGGTTDAGIDGYYIPGELCGHLYIDYDGNGVQNAGEPNLANVDVIITDSNGDMYTVTTDINGDYCQEVPPGTAVVDVDETDPDYPAGSEQTEGDDPTTVTVTPGGTTDAGNDGYFLASSVFGHLYLDTNGNGVQDPGEPDLANVDVIITDGAGNVLTVTTDANGDYSSPVFPGSVTVDVDETDPDYPAGSEQTEGEEPTIVTVNPGEDVDAGNDGYYYPAQVCGHLYIDADGNGVQGPGEADLAGVDVIITDSEGMMYTVTTDANGDYCQLVPPGTTVIDIDETDPDYPTGYEQTEGDDPTTVTAEPATVTDAGNDGFYSPTTVFGHVYYDENNNGVQDAGELDLEGIDVLVTQSDGTTLTVTTDANGDWSTNVVPGLVIALVDENDPDFPVGATQTEGDNPTVINALLGEDTDAGIDGYFVPTSVFGHLYYDENNNGVQDPGELDLADVDVIITDSNGAMQTVTTDADGNWSASVPAGTTTADVDESDPDYPTGAAQTEGDDPTTINAQLGVANDAGNDGYHLAAEVIGHVYFDSNNNGVQDIGEPDLANIDVIITESDGTQQTVTTDQNGNWSAIVEPGLVIADVDETDPDYPAGSVQTEGDDPTSIIAAPGTVTDAGNDGYYVGSAVFGHLYLDSNNNGVQDALEPDLPFVDVIVTDANGVVQTVTSDINGDWNAIVEPGTTTADVDETDPDFPAGSVQTEGDDPTTVTAIGGAATDAGNDGYFAPAEIVGHVYLDENNNGVQDAGEPDLPNIDVIITEADGTTQTVVTDQNGDWSAIVEPGLAIADVDETDPDYPANSIQTEGDDPTNVIAVEGTVVDAGNDGYFVGSSIFGHLYLDENNNGVQDALEPDLADVDVIITTNDGSMITVTSDVNGDWSSPVPSGTTIADVDESDPDYPTGAEQTEGTDPTTVNVISGTATDAGNDGYFLPAEIVGHLYLDTNNNGVQDAGEPDLANVDVIITEADGTMQTVTTDANGDWTAQVEPGLSVVDVDEDDPDYPTGSTQTEGTDPSPVVAVEGTVVDAGNDGYFFPTSVFGHVYLDENNNGVQDPGELDLAGIDVVVTSSDGVQTVTTDSNGDWSADVNPGTVVVNVDETDPDYPTGAVQTEGEDPTFLFDVPAGEATDAGNDGYFVPTSIFGHLYLDENNNGIQDVTEPNLANVDVIITDGDANVQTVTTDANGDWTADVVPGLTVADVDETDADYPTGSTQTEGDDPTFNFVPEGSNLDFGNDGYYTPAEVFGHLYLDENNNGVQDAGEPNLAGVDVIVTSSNGTTQTVTTDAGGDWSAVVVPGMITANVDENDPQYPTGSTQTEGDDPSTVLAASGSSMDAGNDGYYLEVTGTITGNVSDSDGNPIPLVSLTLNDGNAATVDPTVITDQNGDYIFSDVVEGNYTIVETQPAGYNSVSDQDDTPDPDGADGETANDEIPVVLLAGEVDADNNFVEELPGEIAGTVTDVNGNPLEGVVITLDDGDALTTDPTATTDANGDYIFTDVSPGDYTLIETQPAGYDSVSDDDASPEDATDGDGLVDNTIDVTVTQGETDTDNNFVEIGTGMITGNVSEDTDGDGVADLPLPGVVITLDDGNPATVDPTATTDGSGDYVFTGLAPGDYTVLEEQPVGYTDVSEGDNAPDASDATGPDDTVDNALAVTLTPGEVDSGNDFLEAPIVTSVFGHLYYDSNGNGVQDAGEPDLAGVDVVITQSNGTMVTVTSDANGDYSSEVVAGLASINVDETDPDYPAGSTQTEGNDPTTVNAILGNATDAGIDGYYLPGSVSGNVSDDSGNPIAGVELTLTDGDAATPDLTATTDANGNYLFPEVAAGDYTLVETQPAGYASVSDTDETPEDATDGDLTVDDMIAVTVGQGEADDDNNFVEQLTTIFGHVYLDSNNNGVQDAGEPNLANIDVIITQADGTTVTAVTDANGDWSSPVIPGLTSAEVDTTDPDFPVGLQQTEGDNPTFTNVLAGMANDGGIDGFAGVPDITPVITFLPTSVNGPTEMVFTIKTQELLDVPTNGLITLILPKDDRLTFTWEQSLTAIGPFALENQIWTYDGSNPSFHIWTTTEVIDALGSSTFGFNAVYDPENTTGEVPFTVTIVTGSGSEVNFDNNIDAETLDYFSN